MLSARRIEFEPALRVDGTSPAINVVTRRQYGVTLARMALRGRDLADASVVVSDVGPVVKAGTPGVGHNSRQARSAS